jgi:hypothetical protein
MCQAVTAVTLCANWKPQIRPAPIISGSATASAALAQSPRPNQMESQCPSRPSAVFTADQTGSNGSTATASANLMAGNPQHASKSRSKGCIIEASCKGCLLEGARPRSFRLACSESMASRPLTAADTAGRGRCLAHCHGPSSRSRSRRLACSESTSLRISESPSRSESESPSLQVSESPSPRVAPAPTQSQPPRRLAGTDATLFPPPH